jgi:hypothetical protein
MAQAIIILAIVLGFGWACFVSRTFRIVVGLVVLAGVAWVVMKRDEADKQKVADQASAQTATERHKARQADLWSKVSASQAELRTPQLSAEKFGDGRFELTGSIKNLSNQQLGAFEIDVTARDCPANEKCEVVGHSTEVFWADVPAQQVRGITGKITFPNLPQLRGRFSPQFVIKRVYAGDILDQWDIGDQK